MESIKEDGNYQRFFHLFSLPRHLVYCLFNFHPVKQVKLILVRIMLTHEMYKLIY